MATLTREHARLAADEGAAANRSGLPLTACPYSGTSTRVEERFAHWHWIRGWLDAAGTAEPPVAEPTPRGPLRRRQQRVVRYVNRTR